MSGNDLKHISDFDWASVSTYLIWLEGAAGLIEINSSHVNSFPFAQFGPEKLEARKKNTLGRLELNLSRLEAFVGRNSNSLDKQEMAVIRGMYRSILGAKEVVQDHIIQVGRMKNMSQEIYTMIKGKEEENDVPF